MSRRRWTTEEFIERAKLVHGTYYDYSKVEYVTSSIHVMIIDPEFGEFRCSPSNHLRGKGHRKAGIARTIKAQRQTTEYFIKKSKSIHGEFYDYSQAEYVNSTTPVTLVHPIHGKFKIRPVDHYRGGGHQKLRYINSAKKQSLTTEEFIKKARLVHGDIHDYSKVEYIKTHAHVTIIHPKHGEFRIRPSNFLQGNDHPLAKGSGFSCDKNAIFYVYWIPDYDLLKVGISNRTLEKRVKNFGHEILELIVIQFEAGKMAKDLESVVLQKFECGTTDFRFEGYTETMSCDVLQDLEYFIADHLKDKGHFAC